MKTILTAITLTLLLTACGGPQAPSAPEEPDLPPAELEEPLEEASPEEETSPEDPTEAALQALLEDMTLEEKAGQLFFAHLPAENAGEDAAAYHLGGYILFGRDIEGKTANDLIQAIHSYQRAACLDTGVPLLIGVDEEGGSVVRVSSNPHLRSKKFSSPRKLREEGEKSGKGPLAYEEETHEKDLLLRALGFNVNLNPVADVSDSPGDFIYDRTTGGDADAARAYVARVVEVQGRDGVGSVLKHFPGYGDNKDTHTGSAVDQRPLEAFWERDFLPFQAGIAAGESFPGAGPAVLVSHNVVSCMDPDLPASLSPEVHRILREDLGFDGVVMTDDLAMEAVARYGTEGAVMSIRAGNDLVVTSDYRTQIPRVIEALRDGTLGEEAVDAACLRVLRWKAELGLLELSEDGFFVPAVCPEG